MFDNLRRWIFWRVWAWSRRGNGFVRNVWFCAGQKNFGQEDCRSNINTKAANGSFCNTCMCVRLFGLSLSFEVLVEKEQLERKGVMPV